MSPGYTAEDRCRGSSQRGPMTEVMPRVNSKCAVPLWRTPISEKYRFPKSPGLFGTTTSRELRPPTGTGKGKTQENGERTCGENPQPHAVVQRVSPIWRNGSTEWGVVRVQPMDLPSAGVPAPVSVAILLQLGLP